MFLKKAFEKLKKKNKGQTENKQQDKRLKSNYITNHIKWKQSKCPNQKAEIFRMNFF